MYHASENTHQFSVTRTIKHRTAPVLRLSLLALLLVMCQYGAAIASPVPESGMLLLNWDTPETTVHHYVLEITKTVGDEMADPETILAYTDDTVYELAVMDGFTYAVRILSVDEYGSRSVRSDAVVFMVEQNMIVEKNALSDNALPQAFSLHQNHPNPFNPVTTISYDLPAESHVTLTIYNITGQKVTVLHDGHMTAGSHAIVWDAADMPSGTYFYTVTTNQHRTSRKMLLLK